MFSRNSRNLASFIPANMIAAPRGTTHFKIISGAAEIDFEGETYVVATSETAILPWNATAKAVINQVNAVTANSTHPLFLALGVEFYQEINGEMYPLKNGAFNPLSIELPWKNNEKRVSCIPEGKKRSN